MARPTHPEHLNTPRLVADAAGTTVWRWGQQEPFGNTPPDENPSGLGVFENNLRFPGQYFDKETGLFYNYFRDYDSAIGGYKQSDPIGLDGGINTYAYIEGTPLLMTDFYGNVGIVGAVVKLLEKGGMVVVKSVSKAEAVAARRSGENVVAETRQMAKQIEQAAANGGPVIKHTKAHDLPGGAKGRPHFQSKGKRGHTFWGIGAGGVVLVDEDSAENYCPQPGPSWGDRARSVAEWLVDFLVSPGEAR